MTSNETNNRKCNNLPTTPFIRFWRKIPIDGISYIEIKKPEGAISARCGMQIGESRICQILVDIYGKNPSDRSRLYCKQENWPTIL